MLAVGECTTERCTRKLRGAFQPTPLADPSTHLLHRFLSTLAHHFSPSSSQVATNKLRQSLGSRVGLLRSLPRSSSRWRVETYDPVPEPHGRRRGDSSAFCCHTAARSPAQMFFRPHAGGADSALAMGDTGRSNFGLDPVTAQVGSHLLSSGSSLVSERLGRGWASVDSLRYYFAVSNSYVQNKLRLVLFPFLRRDWARLVVAQSSDQEAYRPPRDDLNAPDLYIPLVRRGAGQLFVAHMAVALGLDGVCDVDHCLLHCAGHANVLLTRGLWQVGLARLCSGVSRRSVVQLHLMSVFTLPLQCCFSRVASTCCPMHPPRHFSFWLHGAGTSSWVRASTCSRSSPWAPRVRSRARRHVWCSRLTALSVLPCADVQCCGVSLRHSRAAARCVAEYRVFTVCGEAVSPWHDGVAARVGAGPSTQRVKETTRGVKRSLQ